MSSRMVSATAPRLVATSRRHHSTAQSRGDRPRQHSSCRPGRSTHSSRCPSSSKAKRSKVQVDPIVRESFLDMLDQWRTERRWARSGACARSSGCAPGCSTGSTRTLPTAGNGAGHQKHRSAGKVCLSPADIPQRVDDQRLGAGMASMSVPPTAG